MYIEQGYRGLHEGWRYVVGFIIVFFAWQILGGIPLIFALIVKSYSFTAITNDMGAMAQMLGLNWFFCLVMLTFVFAMAGLYVAVKFLHKLPWLHFTTARNKVDWNRIIFAFLLWGILSVSMILVDVFLTPEHYVLQFDLIPFLILLLLSIVLLPIQTSFEEYFTRGYLMQGIGIAAKNRWLPFLVSSTLFGILHIFNPEVQKLGYGILVYYIGTGFFLGILTLMDDGLELPLGFHAANNFFAALIATADWMAFNTHSIYKDISDPVLGWDVLVPVLIIYPILILVFSKKYKWTNWKEKLFGRVLTEEEFRIVQDGDSSTV